MVGAIWALSAAVAFSLSNIAIAKGIQGTGVALGTVLMLVGGTLVAVVAALAFDGTGVIGSATVASLMFFAAAGGIHFVGGWAFMNASIARIGASRASAITGVTPMFAAVLAIVTLHEGVDLTMGLGILGIVGGTYFIATS